MGVRGNNPETKGEERNMCPFDACSTDHNESQECSQDAGPFDPNGAQLDGDTSEFERLNDIYSIEYTDEGALRN